MPAPLYIALIRHTDGSMDVRTYTSTGTMIADDKHTRIVVDWADRGRLADIVRTGRDWPVDTPDNQRASVLDKLNRLIALHDNN